jgi:hypothetical protein
MTSSQRRLLLADSSRSLSLCATSTFICSGMPQFGIDGESGASPRASA